MKFSKLSVLLNFYIRSLLSKQQVLSQFEPLVCFNVRRQASVLIKFSYSSQSSPTEGHIWKWLKNIIEVLFLLDLYLYSHISYESYKKNQYGINQELLVLAHTVPLHYWIGCRERFSVTKKHKSTRNIKVKIKALHGALDIYILKGSMSGFLI